MKQYLLVTAIIGLCSGIAFMGFQCGSAESTSAKLYQQRGDFPAMEKALMKELAKNPNNAEAWFLLGDARMHMDSIRGMVNAFDSCAMISKEYQDKIHIDKTHVWVEKLNLGVHRFNASRDASKDSSAMLVQSAIAAYDLALIANPDSATTYQNMAIAQMVAGNKDKQIFYSIEALKRTADLRLSYSLSDVYMSKSKDAKAAGDQAQADKHFQSAVGVLTAARKANSDSISYYTSQMKMATDQQKPRIDSALQFAKKADMEILSAQIDDYIEVGKSKDALPLMQEALTSDPNNKVLHANIGLLLMQTGDLKSSVDHFNTAVKLDSSYIDALRNGAIAMMKAGQAQKDQAREKQDPKTGAMDKSYQKVFYQAATLLEKYLTIKPDESAMWQALATAYGGADNTKKAAEALKKADALDKK